MSITITHPYEDNEVKHSDYNNVTQVLIGEVIIFDIKKVLKSAYNYNTTCY